MKRKRRKQLQRHQAIFMISIVVFMGMVWSIYALSSTISGNLITTSAESTVSLNKNMATPQEVSKRYKIVIDLLQQEPMFEANMTRTDNTFVELKDRAQIANDLDTDAFVSIHGNTFIDPDVSGKQTYYYADDSLQIGSLTNLSDETNMLDEMHQNRTAQTIVKGIKKYFADREG